MNEVKLCSVYLDKVTGFKFVVGTAEKKKVEENQGRYEYICNRPHEDGDYSYLCFSEYCRCSS